MSQKPTRRRVLSALGSASLAALAGCSSSSDPQSTATPTQSDSPTGSSTQEADREATQPPSLESGTISTTPLSDIAGIIPQVDPLVVSAWKSPSGGISVVDPAEFDERKDTLRYNTVNGRLAPTAMAAYLLSRENAPFVGPLWLGYLENDITVEWSAVVAGVSVMYADGIGLSTVRTRAAQSDVEYETITDSDSAVILRSSDGAVVGVTSNVFAFVPATDNPLPFSPVSRVTALIETANGNRTSLASQDSLLKTTLQHARVQGIVHLAHSQNAPLGEALPAYRRSMGDAMFSVAGSATGYDAAQTAVCQLDEAQEAPVSATATIGFPEGEGVDEAELIANVGNLGVEREYVRDEDIVRVSCEYPEDALSAILSESSLGA